MAQLALIDITNNRGLRRLAEDVRDSRKPVVLRTEGEEVAVLMPISRSGRRRKRELTKAEYDAVMAAAGGWKGLVDTEKLKLKEELAAARGSDRPPVGL